MKKLNFKNYILPLAVVLMLFSFLIGYQVNAGLADAVSGIVGHIIQFFIWILGGVLFVLIYILIWVAQYNGFINADAVTNGWVIVRDLCNMFFILILLIIAFATILRLPNYEWKKLLPKLLIMAVLINFSKTICGLIIDFAQVIMLTFVNGFKDMGSQNLTTMLGIKDILAIDASADDIKLLNIVGSYFLALLYTIISVIVILVIIAVLVMRMVMLWIYIVLSPLAYLLSAFPAGQKYASQWWSEFAKNVIIGPVLAFFIWLSFVSLGSGANPLKDTPEPGDTGKTTQISGVEIPGPNAGIAKAGKPADMLKFIISIGMLIGGLMITQQMGGMAGAAAGKGMAAIQKGKGLVGKGLLKGARTVGSWGLDKTSQLTKGRVDFNLARTWGRFKTQMDENKAERVVGIEQKVAAKAGEGNRLAMLTHGALAARNLSSWQGWKGFAMGRGRFKYSNEAKKLEEERKGVLSNNDAMGVLKDQKTKKETLKTLQDNIALKDIAIRGKAVDDPERAKLVEEKKILEDQYTDTKKQIGENDKKLGQRTVDKATGKFKYANVDDAKAKTLDKEIADNRDKASEVALRGKDIVKGAEAEAVAIQEKKITHIDNFSELGEIFNQAIREGNVGLQAAVARKMTKNGDYNELASIMKVGTGTKGMQDLAKIMEKSGGMSQQMSRGLVADMGVMCKNLGQFGGFAAMKMDKSGNWQEASEDEAQGAQLAEMQKMEPQAFARTVNRLGLGHYDDDGDPSKAGVHDESTWHLSKAATIYLKTNQEALGEQYKRRGMQNAIEHLSSKIGQLAANGVKSGDGSLIETIEARGHKGGTNPMEQVKTVKT